jgi:hypothetical protein
MGRTAKFVVVGDRSDLNGARQATVLIDRDTGLVTVKPYRQHKTYSLPLLDLARSVIVRCVQAEIQENKPKRRFLAKRSVLS